MIDTIIKELKSAMLKKDKKRVDTLRNILSKLKLREIEKKRSLTDEEAIKVIQGIAKQIKDSIEQFINGGRQDLADNERAELEILSEFLPEPMENDEIIKIIEKIISDTNAKNLNDLGKVIGDTIKATNGRADGSTISKIAREKLS